MEKKETINPLYSFWKHVDDAPIWNAAVVPRHSVSIRSNVPLHTRAPVVSKSAYMK